MGQFWICILHNTFANMKELYLFNLLHFFLTFEKVNPDLINHLCFIMDWLSKNIWFLFLSILTVIWVTMKIVIIYILLNLGDFSRQATIISHICCKSHLPQDLAKGKW